MGGGTRMKRLPPLDDDPLDDIRRTYDNAPWWRNIEFWYAALLFAILAAAIAWVIIHSGTQVAL